MNKLVWQLANMIMVPFFLLAGYQLGLTHTNWVAFFLLLMGGTLADIALIAFVTLDTWDKITE